MITERTLRKWRKEALTELVKLKGWDNEHEFTKPRRELCDRIVRLTQDLLDVHLLSKVRF